MMVSQLRSRAAGFARNAVAPARRGHGQVGTAGSACSIGGGVCPSVPALLYHIGVHLPTGASGTAGFREIWWPWRDARRRIGAEVKVR
jgi:hypothetical protein